MPVYNQNYLDKKVKQITESLRREYPDEEFSEEKTRTMLKANVKQFARLK